MNAAFILLGLTGCELGTSYHLPRIVGPTVASELLLTGRFIDAERALRVGLISELYEDEASMEVGARQLAEDMLRTSILGLKLTKEGLNSSATMNLDATLHMESVQQVLCFKTPQCVEVGLAYAASIIEKSKVPRSKL